MTTVYKRPKETDTFKCHECGTVWKDEWLEKSQLGWCPACHVENIPAEITKLGAVVPTKHTPERRKALKKIVAEELFHEKQYEKFMAESTALVCGSSGDLRTTDQLRSAHMKDLGKLEGANAEQWKLAAIIAENS